MLRIVVALALFAHGFGHAVGFWMPVPQWLALAWLVPGAIFIYSGWGAWLRAQWWPATAIVGAVLSMAVVLLLLPTALLAAGPFASGFAFDAVVLALLMVPWSRRQLLAWSAKSGALTQQ